MTKKKEKNLQSSGLADLQATKTLTRHFVTPSPKGRGERTAFTLAEVLITLGIIGVVAAMTIPTLVANYQEKSWNTSAQVFERKLEEALKTMNTQSVLAGHTTTQSFINELAKHFKIVKTCDSNNLKNCVEENITWNIIDISNVGSESETLNLANLKTAADLGKADWDTETIGVQFANGTTAIMAYDPECKQDPYSNTVTGMSCISMIYDTSGGKSPNATSKDIRVINNKIANCAFKSGSTCFSQPTKAYEAHVWNACDAEGNTTDPDDLVFMSKYGIQNCLSSHWGTDDYWAGAVELCGGISKMLDMSQLAGIANYVYNTNNIGINSEIEDIIFDNAKANELGLPSPSFYLLSGQEDSNIQTPNRSFSLNSTSRSYYSRKNQGGIVICIE